MFGRAWKSWRVLTCRRDSLKGRASIIRRIPARQRERFRAISHPQSSRHLSTGSYRHMHACPPSSSSVENVGRWLWTIPRGRLNTPPERPDKQRIRVPSPSLKKSGSFAPQRDTLRGTTSDKPWGYFPQALRATWVTARYRYFSPRHRLQLGAAKGVVLPTKN